MSRLLYVQHYVRDLVAMWSVVMITMMVVAEQRWSTTEMQNKEAERDPGRVRT